MSAGNSPGAPDGDTVARAAEAVSEFVTCVRVEGVEFARTSGGKLHSGYANQFSNGHRALFAQCGVYGVFWAFTENPSGRERCKRCFASASPAAGVTGGRFHEPFMNEEAPL